MPPKPPRQTIILTEFDECTIGRSTQLLKALIPFWEPSQQRMFGLMVRIIEFNMTVDFFNHNRIPACAFKPCCGSDMLSELKSYCSPDEQKQLDMMIGMIKAQKLQAALASGNCCVPPPPPPPGDKPKPDGGKPDKCPPPKPPCPPPPPSPIDLLSGVLSPEQLAMCRKFEDLL